MNISDCSFRWQAEAIEDGRLSNSETTSFRRHATGCVVCRREIAELQRLHTVAKRLEFNNCTPLERQRLRLAILRQASGLAARPRSTWSFALGFTAAATILACFIWIVGARYSRVNRPITPLVQAPTFQMSASADAHWYVEKQAPRLCLRLDRGIFTIHVDKLQSNQGFVAHLPDGELEVRGTTFLVKLGSVETKQVQVTEGHVLLRIHGHEEHQLGPGDQWSSNDSIAQLLEAPVNSAAPTSVAKADNTENVPPVASARSAKVSRLEATNHSVSPVASSTASSATTSLDAGFEFGRAMAAFRKGDLLRADRLLTQFEQQFPSDARAEDAAFLRIVCSSQNGDMATAKLRAGEYLHRYPNGLRRFEAEKLLR